MLQVAFTPTLTPLPRVLSAQILGPELTNNSKENLPSTGQYKPSQASTPGMETVVTPTQSQFLSSSPSPANASSAAR